MYVSTELIGGAEEPAFECAVVKARSCSTYWNQAPHEAIPRSGMILAGTYQSHGVEAQVNAITGNLNTNLAVGAFGRVAGNRNLAMRCIGGSLQQDDSLSCGDQKIIYFLDGAILRETEDLIVTNGQCGTVIECTQFSGLRSLALNPLGSGGGLLLLLNADDTVQVRSTLGWSEINQISQESAKQPEKQRNLRLAYQIAMEALSSAEKERAQAVEQEARLGINWDDWKDDPH